MNVFIITEGGENIGFGHITRCTSLSQAFEDKGIQPVFIVNGDVTVRDLLKDEVCEFFDWAEESERLLNLIKDADIAVIDSYRAGSELYKKVSELVKIPVYIDDFKRIDYPDGIVVNGTIYAEDLTYPEREGISYLLGIRYFPLRREYRNVQDKKIKDDIESVMITFGGNDTRNLTVRVLKLLIDNYPELAKKIVVGKGCRNAEEIEKLKDRKTELMYSPDAGGMKDIMLESDMAISAGGQTLYELARVGVPTIAVAVAGNQLNNIKGWQKAGFVEYAGWWEDGEVLNNVINKTGLLKDNCLRSEKAKTGRMMLDGLGAVRTVGCCLERYFEESIVLREARMDDMNEIYNLSNEPEVRQNSFNQEGIGIEHHKNWFVDRLNDEYCLFLIAELNKEFLGQVRFDIDRNEAVVSISIGKNYRGSGIGRLINKKALKYLRSVIPGIETVKAYIKEGNISSVRFFTKSDFRFSKRLVLKNQNALEYSYQLKEDRNEVSYRKKNY